MEFRRFGIKEPRPSENVLANKYYLYRSTPLRYDINTGTGQFGKFGMTSKPALDTSESSVRYQGTDLYAGTGRSGNLTGTGYFGTFGTTSTPVPDTSVSSVRHPYR